MSKEYATIDGFEKLTAQEVFDISVGHLLRQKEKSLSGTGGPCLYRGYGGRMCAAGPFLKDACAEMCEGFGWDHLVETRRAQPTNEGLMCKLQEIHDNHPVDSWAVELRTAAKNFNLEFKF